MTKKKNSKYSVDKPNPFIYAVLKIGSWFMARIFYNIRIIKNDTKGVKGPYVVIQNHESQMDFYSSYYGINRTAHAVISNSFYQVSKIRKYMKLSGTIPKQQFQTSIGDLKIMKSALEQGRPLIFYPQGLMTEDGIATIVPKATGKALKWFRQDVYVANISGTYLSNPKWSSIKRRGRPTLSIAKLFSKEELENLSQEEIERIVEEKLYFDAYKNQEKNRIPYKNGDLIEGLHYPLYKCPKCEKEFSMKTEKNRIYCTHCGNKGYADKLGFLYPETKQDVIFKHPSDWSRFIQKHLEDDIKLVENYAIESTGILHILNYDSHQFEIKGDCEIKLDNTGFTLTFTNQKEEIIKHFDTTGIYLIPFASGKYFELQDGLDIYRIYISNPEQISKWMNVHKTYYRIRNNLDL